MAAKPNPPAVEQQDSRWCAKCKTTDKRSLVVCIDGTSNQFSIRNTNVVELYSHLTKNEDQRTFYNSGIGTYAKPHGLTFRQWISNKLDLAIAWRFDKVLLSAYRWLSENYETGDRIFLFGFSRGAYQVRALSAMIQDVGLIHKGNQDQIPFAYKLYADPNSRQVSSAPLSTWESVQSYLYYLVGKQYPLKTGLPVDLAARFKKTFSRQDVKVHFVGVWDTVSSVGVVYDKTLPGTTNGMEHACFFRHALAIHERRVKFLPEFVGAPKTGSSNEAKTAEGDRSSGGAGAQHNPTSDVLHGNEASTFKPAGPSGSNRETQTVQGADDSPRDITKGLKKDTTLGAQEPPIKEVWFAGSHSDIGGGNVPNAGLDRFGPSLRWMLFESMLAGLNLGDDPLKWEDDPATFKPYKSLTWEWWILEWLPVKRPSFLDSSKRDATTRWPHRGQWRRAIDGQKLHATALEVIGRDRLPAKALTYILEREEDDDADSAGAPSEHAQGRALAPPSHSAARGPDLKLWPDLDIESDPYQDALSFLQLLKARGLTRESDVGRLETLLDKEAGQDSIRDAIQKLIDEDVHSIYPNYGRVAYSGWDLETELQLEKSRGKVLSGWGSRLLLILKDWDENRSAAPGYTRALRAVFALFEHLNAKLSFPQSRELRRLAKSFAARGSEGSEKFLLLVNSVTPDALDFSFHNRDENYSAVFHPDGKRVIIALSFAKDCLVLDYSSFPPSPPLHLVRGDRVYIVALSGDGAFIGISLDYGRERVLTIWDAASPGDEPIHTLENAPAVPLCLAFNHDGTRLVAGCIGGAIIVWTKADGPVWAQLASFPQGSISSISWSLDNYVAVGSGDGFLSVWDMRTASAPTELLPRTKVGSYVECLAFAPMTTPGSSPIRIVTGGRMYPNPAHWQLGVVEDGVYRLLGYLMGHDNFSSPTCVSFSQDGKQIASGLSSGMVRIWDADSCEPVCDDIHIPGSPRVLALSFEPDDTAVKAVCEDFSVRLLCWK